MAKRRKTNNFSVGINGRHVGTFERNGATHAFAYDDEWLSTEYAHPISLSMSLTKKDTPVTWCAITSTTYCRTTKRFVS
ncbi:hypothetical protein KUL106_18370 [Alteromonas sp. KUL106]|nr:HipA N-terminal domain-containing protein [Alteromonas sp. KUL106]GFD68574.1 hypothetical protein KUL106_18370 [Alteromonas sp. KUL106]